MKTFKRGLALLLAICLSVGIVPLDGIDFKAFAAGNTISSASDWAKANFESSGTVYTLTSDISLSADQCSKNYLKATIDGGGHTITIHPNGNTLANRVNTTRHDFGGLFNTISSEGYIHDVTVRVAQDEVMRIDSEHSIDDVGVIAGRCYGKIENAAVVGSEIEHYINNRSADMNVGAVVGIVYSGAVINKVYVDNVVIERRNTNDTGLVCVGGIAGFSERNSKITNSVVKNLTHDTWSHNKASGTNLNEEYGILVGRAFGTLQNCYAQAASLSVWGDDNKDSSTVVYVNFIAGGDYHYHSNCYYVSTYNGRVKLENKGGVHYPGVTTNCNGNFSDHSTKVSGEQEAFNRMGSNAPDVFAYTNAHGLTFKWQYGPEASVAVSGSEDPEVKVSHKKSPASDKLDITVDFMERGIAAAATENPKIVSPNPAVTGIEEIYVDGEQQQPSATKQVFKGQKLQLVAKLSGSNLTKDTVNNFEWTINSDDKQKAEITPKGELTVNGESGNVFTVIADDGSGHTKNVQFEIKETKINATASPDQKIDFSSTALEALKRTIKASPNNNEKVFNWSITTEGIKPGTEITPQQEDKNQAVLTVAEDEEISPIVVRATMENGTVQDISFTLVRPEFTEVEPNLSAKIPGGTVYFGPNEEAGSFELSVDPKLNGQADSEITVKWESKDSDITISNETSKTATLTVKKPMENGKATSKNAEISVTVTKGHISQTAKTTINIRPIEKFVVVDGQSPQTDLSLTTSLPINGEFSKKLAVHARIAAGAIGSGIESEDKKLTEVGLTAANVTWSVSPSDAGAEIKNPEAHEPTFKVTAQVQSGKEAAVEKKYTVAATVKQSKGEPEKAVGTAEAQFTIAHPAAKITSTTPIDQPVSMIDGGTKSIEFDVTCKPEFLKGWTWSVTATNPELEKSVGTAAFTNPTGKKVTLKLTDKKSDSETVGQTCKVTVQAKNGNTVISQDIQVEFQVPKAVTEGDKQAVPKTENQPVQKNTANQVTQSTTVVPATRFKAGAEQKETFSLSLKPTALLLTGIQTAADIGSNGGKYPNINGNGEICTDKGVWLPKESMTTTYQLSFDDIQKQGIQVYYKILTEPDDYEVKLVNGKWSLQNNFDGVDYTPKGELYKTGEHIPLKHAGTSYVAFALKEESANIMPSNTLVGEITKSAEGTYTFKLDSEKSQAANQREDTKLRKKTWTITPGGAADPFTRATEGDKITYTAKLSNIRKNGAIPGDCGRALANESIVNVTAMNHVASLFSKESSGSVAKGDAVAVPTFSPQSGQKVDAGGIQLRCNTEGSEIYFVITDTRGGVIKPEDAATNGELPAQYSPELLGKTYKYNPEKPIPFYEELADMHITAIAKKGETLSIRQESAHYGADSRWPLNQPKIKIGANRDDAVTYDAATHYSRTNLNVYLDGMVEQLWGDTAKVYYTYAPNNKVNQIPTPETSPEYTNENGVPIPFDEIKDAQSVTVNLLITKPNYPNRLMQYDIAFPESYSFPQIFYAEPDPEHPNQYIQGSPISNTDVNMIEKGQKLIMRVQDTDIPLRMRPVKGKPVITEKMYNAYKDDGQPADVPQKSLPGEFSANGGDEEISYVFLENSNYDVPRLRYGISSGADSTPIAKTDYISGRPIIIKQISNPDPATNGDNAPLAERENACAKLYYREEAVRDSVVVIGENAQPGEIIKMKVDIKSADSSKSLEKDFTVTFKVKEKMQNPTVSVTPVEGTKDKLEVNSTISLDCIDSNHAIYYTTDNQNLSLTLILYVYGKTRTDTPQSDCKITLWCVGWII